MKRNLEYIAIDIASHLGDLMTIAVDQINEETIKEATEADLATWQIMINLKDSVQEYLEREAEMIDEMNRSIKRLEDKLIKD